MLQHEGLSKGGEEDRSWERGPDGFWFGEAMSRIRSFILRARWGVEGLGVCDQNYVLEISPNCYAEKRLKGAKSETHKELLQSS